MPRFDKVFTLILIGFLVVSLLAGCAQGVDKQKLEQEVAATLFAAQTTTAESVTLYQITRATENCTPPCTPPPSRTPLPTASPTPTIPPIPAIGTALPQPLAVINSTNVSGLARLARWSKGSLYAAAFTRDGATLGVVTGEGVRLYDPRTMDEIRFFPVEGAMDIAFSPDGGTIAVLSNLGRRQGEISLWPVTGGESLIVFSGAEGNEGDDVAADQIRFSGDGDSLIGVGTWADGSHPTRLTWSLPDGELWDSDQLSSDENLDLTISPDASYILGVNGGTLAEPGFFRIWDRSGQVIFNIADQGATEASLSSDGELVAVKKYDHSSGDQLGLSIWRVKNEAELAALSPVDLLPPGSGGEGDASSTSNVTALNFNAEGDALLLVTWDGRLLRWWWDSGELETLLNDLPGRVDQIVVSPTGLILMLTKNWLTDQQEGLVWHLGGDQPLKRIPESYGPMEDLAFDPQGQEVVTLSIGGQAAGRDARDGLLKWELAIAVEDIWRQGHGMSLSPEGRWLAYWNWDPYLDSTIVQKIRLVHLPDGKEYPLDIGGFLKTLDLVTFSPEGSWMVTYDILQVRIWPLKEGLSVPNIEWISAEDSITALEFSPNGDWLARRDESGKIAVWRVSNGKLHTTLDGPPGYGGNLAFSTDGSRLASSGEDGSVWSFDTDSGELVGRFLLSADMLPVKPERFWLGRASGMAFNRDGQVLFILYGTYLTAWQVEGGALLAARELDHPPGTNSGLVLSPDGSLLLWADEDGVIEVWGGKK